MYKVMYVSHNLEDSDCIPGVLGEGFEFATRPEPIGDDEDRLIEYCRGADAVIGDYQFFSRRVLESLPQLKLVQFMSVGFNYIDADAAKELSIGVCNCPTYCTNEVADHTTALILAINRRLFQYHRDILNGIWAATVHPNMLSMRELTIGLAGFGAIPKQVAKRVMAFGAKVVAYDPYIPAEVMAGFGVEKVNLDELAARSDYISCHVPATPETIGMFNAEFFAKCRDGLVFINTSRGSLHVEADLIEALESGKVAFAGLDVLGSEQPDPKTEPLCNMENVIVTPHAAFYSASARRNSRIEAATSVRNYLTGKYELCPIRNGVRGGR